MVKIRRNKITDNLENTLIEVFERTHKCPWYKTLFKLPMVVPFTYLRESTDLGCVTFVHCNMCGKTFNVTNYNNW